MKMQHIKIFRIAAKAVTRGKFIELLTLEKKKGQERSQINNVSSYLKKLQNEGESKLKVNRKEIIMGRDQNNWKQKQEKKINETKSWFSGGGVSGGNWQTSSKTDKYEKRKDNNHKYQNEITDHCWDPAAIIR